jgi:hypothetical protein
MMLESTKDIVKNMWGLKGEITVEVGQHQHQHDKGVGGQLQNGVWGPRGSQQQQQRSHEQQLLIFVSRGV